MQIATPHDRLHQHLASLRRGLMTRSAGRGTLAFLAAASAAAAVAIVIQGLLGPRLVLGIVLGVAFLAISGWVFWRALLQPIVRFPSLRRLAMWVDREIPGDEDRAINAFDLARQRAETSDPLSRSLIERAIAESLPPVEAIGVRTLDRGPRVLPRIAAIAAAVAVLGVFQVLAPMRLRASFLALLHPTTFPYSPEVVFEVDPGDESVDSGGDVAIRAEVKGSAEAGRLLYREEGGVWKSLAMKQESTGRVPWEGVVGGSQVSVRREIPSAVFTTILGELRRHTDYRVRVGNHESPTFAIRVLTPPRVTAYDIEIASPAYTGRDVDRSQSPVGNVAALKGSRVRVELVTDGDPGDAEIEWSSGGVEVLSPNAAGRPAFSFTALQRGEYQVRLRDEAGRVRFESPFYPVSVLEDLVPMVGVVQPGMNVDLPEGMRLPITVSCADDYGISRLVMHIHKEPHAPVQKEVRRFARGDREAQVDFDWDLSSLDMVPGEVTTYHFELFDNDVVSGPKSARTGVFEVRFPSVAELYARTEDEYEQNVVGAADDLKRDQEELQDRMERIRQELERSREGVSWERQKEIEGLIQNQEEFQRRLSETMESLQHSIDRLNQSNMADYQILERMEAIRDLLDEVNDERLRAMMEKLREALAQMDPEELEKALESMELTQEEILQELDRAVEHLKQILAEQKLEGLLDQLQAMLEEQARINDQLENPKGDHTEEQGQDSEGQDESDAEKSEGEQSEQGADGEQESGEQKDGDQKDGEQKDGEQKDGEQSASDLEQLAGEEQELAEEAEQTQQAMDELKELAKQVHERLAQELDQMNDRPMEKAQDSMEDASESMRQEKSEDALRYGFKAQEELQALMNMLQGAAQRMSDSRNQELAREMIALGADLLHVSGKEEGIVEAPEAETTRDMAAQQMRLYEATGRASEKLNELGKETLVISQGLLRRMSAVLDDMSEATGNFEDGNRARGNAEAQAAMSGLNKSVIDILRTGQQMNQSGGACQNPNPNAMSRIPTLTGMQRQLNQQTLSLGRQLGKRLSPATGQEALRQLAARQEAIRRGVQEVASELTGRRDVLGRIGDLGKELEEVVADIKRGKIDRQLIQRQEKILNRLLTAEHSIRQQDQDDKRVSRTGEDVLRASPGSPSPGQLGQPDRIDREIMQGRTDPFPARYRSLIEAYFKALSEEKNPDAP